MPRYTSTLEDGAIIGDSRMIRRGVETQIAHRGSASKGNWNRERLDRPVEIFIINDVLVMPDSGGRIRHPITNEANAIDSRRRLELVDGRLGTAGRRPPGIDGRLLPHGGEPGPGKSETGRAGNVKPAIRNVILHVDVIDALARILTAPKEFMRGYILTFRIVGRTRIRSGAQIGLRHQDAVRRAGMRMA